MVLRMFQMLPSDPRANTERSDSTPSGTKYAAGGEVRAPPMRRQPDQVVRILLTAPETRPYGTRRNTTLGSEEPVALLVRREVDHAGDGRALGARLRGPLDVLVDAQHVHPDNRAGSAKRRVASTSIASQQGRRPAPHHRLRRRRASRAQGCGHGLVRRSLRGPRPRDSGNGAHPSRTRAYGSPAGW
jgi:hypothetical protein